MQISRPLLLTCLLASAVLPAITQAADTEAQRKAREALQQKLKEIESQTPMAPQATPAPAPKPQPAPAPKAAKPAAPEFQHLPSQTPAAPPPAATQTLPKRELKVPPAQPAPAAPASDVGYFEPVPQTDNAEAEKARQALREKLRKAEPQPEPTVAEPSRPEKKSEQPEQPKASARSKYQNSLPPLQGPPTGLSPEKEEKLRVLLEDYRADRLTPDQYHTERARILAAP